MPILPNSAHLDTGWAELDSGHDDKGGSKLGNWSSFIGVGTAIAGNVLIALALNVQRYSHIQLHRRRVEARERAKEALRKIQNNGDRNGYGTSNSPSNRAQTVQDGQGGPPGDIHPPRQSFQSGDSACTERSSDEPKVVSTYLKSPSWWLGQVLMTTGEMGNFLAYGFAPASIVSPLGVVALIANCVIAPIFFGEVFRKRDFWGVVIAVAGAVTVVLSANQEETKMDPHDVWEAITTMAFEIYLGVTVFLIIILMWASPRYGNRTILVDLGLVGLFGGYTALTTKGVSSMLSSTLFKAFATPVTYGLIVVLLGTAILQVRYVNKALQRFDSTQVIPIQFVLFTLSVIIGSAVLYRDFERTTTEQAVKFVGGCLLTFFGVFVITSGRPQQDDDEPLSDDEEIEETIGLRDQEGPYTDSPEQASDDQRRISKIHPSRRSSRTSRASFTDDGRLSMPFRDSKVPSTRGVDAMTSRTPLLTPAGPPPLPSTQWRESAEDQSNHPRLPPTISADSIPTIHSVASTPVSEPFQSSNSLLQPSIAPPSPDRPSTPRASTTSSRPHSHHYSNTFISPSPLSSTVTAVISDALRRGDDGTVGRRKSIRRDRPSIRSSLFVPQSEEYDDTLADSLLRSHEADRLQDQEPRQESAEQEHKLIRSCARSLSSTIGGLLGHKAHSRRNTNSEVEGGQDNQPSDSSGPSRSSNT